MIELTDEYLKSQEFSSTILERFMAKIRVDPVTGCWIWNTALHRGYGYINRGIARSVQAPIISAYKASYILFIGPIPKGACVLHKCPGKHNRACVNPAHLKLGCRAENGRDSILQGTNSFCLRTDKYRVKMNPKLAEEIRANWIGYRGEQTEKAKLYGVTRHTISLIIRYKTWSPSYSPNSGEQPE